MTVRLSVLMACCVLCLSGCACPHPPDYNDTPYDDERTAGPGPGDEGCFRRAIF
ncbi:MAG: hypothetical protein H6867_03185 [Rhodospirillales bacterium]|nr:hypothetical protein [Rhodospirillales bacterium]MCB9996155.1 hypothetical protein [Rhodospirillales bacterium]